MYVIHPEATQPFLCFKFLPPLYFGLCGFVGTHSMTSGHLCNDASDTHHVLLVIRWQRIYVLVSVSMFSFPPCTPATICHSGKIKQRDVEYTVFCCLLCVSGLVSTDFAFTGQRYRYFTGSGAITTVVWYQRSNFEDQCDFTESGAIKYCPSVNEATFKNLHK